MGSGSHIFLVCGTMGDVMAARIPDVIDSRFEVREGRPGTGLGLYAVLPIKKQDFVLEYTGTKIPTSVADESESRYLFEIDDMWTVDGPVPTNTAGYINHDCYPNVEADIEDGHIMIYALRDIAAGEELLIDYNEEYFNEFLKPDGCKCASCASGKISPHIKAWQAKKKKAKKAVEKKKVTKTKKQRKGKEKRIY